MSRRGGDGASFVALFLAGLVLFMPPLLLIFDGARTVLGVPLLYFYLFLAWAVLIGLIGLTTHRARAGEDDRASAGGRGPTSEEG